MEQTISKRNQATQDYRDFLGWLVTELQSQGSFGGFGKIDFGETEEGWALLRVYLHGYRNLEITVKEMWEEESGK